MSPILGIYASQISGHLFGPTGAYDSIATTTVGAGGASSITFSSIPSTYTHLQVRMLVRTNRSNSGDGDGLNLQFNSDSGSNYAQHNLYGNGTTVTASAASSQTFTASGRASDAGATSGVFGVIVVDFLDYSNTNKYKTIRNLGGYDNNGKGFVWFSSGLWMSTNAITSMVFSPGGGTAFAEYSQFALYGVKGN